MQLVECVPNVSEGRNQATITALAREITTVPQVELLHLDKGHAANRTVLTCVGEPAALGEAMFRLIAKAVEVIDMRRHRGIHPRLGAVDVVPFVPLKNSSMEMCVGLAQALGQRISRELRLPVYLYADAAATPQRRLLPDIRRGEFEGLATKMREPSWKPDYGPSVPHPTAGVCVWCQAIFDCLQCPS